jgi:hypothetical protein
MPRLYKIQFTAVTISAAQDLFEINVASTKVCRLISAYFGQSSDAGDAEDEQLRWSIITAHSTSGSGGSSATPQPDDPGDAAFAGTAEVNNTTQATGGSPITRASDCFNVRGGLAYRPHEREQIWIPPSGRLVFTVTAPADAITGSGYCEVEEIG